MENRRVSVVLPETAHELLGFMNNLVNWLGDRSNHLNNFVFEYCYGNDKPIRFGFCHNSLHAFENDAMGYMELAEHILLELDRRLVSDLQDHADNRDKIVNSKRLLLEFRNRYLNTNAEEKS